MTTIDITNLNPNPNITHHPNPNIIPRSRKRTMNEKVRDEIARYDTDGNGVLNGQELTKAMENLVKTEVSNRRMHYAIGGLSAFLFLLLGATTGIVWGVGEGIKETRIYGTTLTSAKSGEPVRVASSQYDVSDNYAFISIKSNNDTTNNVVSTASFTGIQSSISSNIDLRLLMEMNHLYITSPTGAEIALRVLGVGRVPKEDSVNGFVVNIVTVSGTVTIDDVLISFSSDIAPLFEEAGFIVSASSNEIGSTNKRRLLGTPSAQGFFNRLTLPNGDTIKITDDLPVASTDVDPTFWQTGTNVLSKAEAINELQNSVLSDIFPSPSSDSTNNKRRKLAAGVTTDSALAAAFHDYVAAHRKVYETAAAQRIAFAAFKRNIRRLISINMDNTVDFWTSMNQYSDVDFPQFAATVLQLNPVLTNSPIESTDLTPTNTSDEDTFVMVQAANPKRVDWMAAGKVTPARDQGGCGSCWAFAATAALESRIMRSKNATLKKMFGSSPHLSVQQLVDCARGGGYGSNGCSGGGSPEAMAYMSKNFLTNEKTYPYRAKDGKCGIKNIPKTAPRLYSKGGSIDIKTRSESALMTALAKNGPVVFYFEVGASFFQYSGGIYSSKSCKANINHAMLIYGYDISPGVRRHWKIKNSWGTGWGEKGTARIAMTGENTAGMCGTYTYLIQPAGPI